MMTTAATQQPPVDSAPAEPLLTVDHLVLRYPVRGGHLEAVSDVSFQVARGETLGLVGESGCGKSSTGRAVMHLPPPTSGTVTLGGQNLTSLPPGELRAARRRMQLIFQDPVSALNPRRRVKDIVAEGLTIAGVSHAEAQRKVAEILELVGMNIDIAGERRPHQLSGGQCQRVAIARALILRPELLVCDEPVASLDVSIQGQVLNLLEDMRSELGLSMLFISHDLSVVHNISDRIAVMYLGKLVELAASDTVTRSPAHPYTRALLDAVPSHRDTTEGNVTALRGEIPSPMNPPSGCRFRTRCPLVREKCARVVPELREIAPGQRVACHFPLHGEQDAA
ncbi:ABC transporter ATP-binding protein [Dactylosporangium sp. CA-092794]|uniref:ABC transporter ATP-binding protein n=1 Tax=Dactylosporangium sp. CA-092794 TaxID=3239929 RepID=UPI003D8C228C